MQSAAQSRGLVSKGEDARRIGPTRPTRIEHVQVILKTVERCNLACKYCYFFFGENQTYRQHPPYISRDSIRKTINFLREGVDSCGLKTVCIGLHGGEPLMQRKADFDWMCTEFQSQLGSVTNLDLTLQTNGTLIDDGWIDLFAKHRVRVGISVDGPKVYNDLARVDHLGRGTHDRVINGFTKVKKAADAGLLRPPSVLCVINTSHDPEFLFNYFLNDLGLLNFDFLLPELTPTEDAVSYGHYLCRLFDVWIACGRSDINLRIFRSLIDKFSGISSFIFPNGNDVVTTRAFKVSSDARLYPDDVLHDESWWTPLVGETHLKDWLDSPYFEALDRLGDSPPEKCMECCWSEICGGGHPWNRCTKERGFDNPSSLCEGLKLIYARTYSYLLSIGVPQDRLLSMLKLS